MALRLSELRVYKVLLELAIMDYLEYRFQARVVAGDTSWRKSRLKPQAIGTERNAGRSFRNGKAGVGD